MIYNIIWYARVLYYYRRRGFNIAMIIIVIIIRDTAESRSLKSVARRLPTPISEKRVRWFFLLCNAFPTRSYTILYIYIYTHTFYNITLRRSPFLFSAPHSRYRWFADVYMTPSAHSTKRRHVDALANCTYIIIIIVYIRTRTPIEIRSLVNPRGRRLYTRSTHTHTHTGCSQKWTHYMCMCVCVCANAT